MNLVNLTPHEINIVFDDETIAIPSSGLARCAVKERQKGTIEYCGKEILLVKTEFGEIEGLPASTGDTVYITSLLVAQAVNRADVVSPGQLVRDTEGKIIGCLSFSLHTE